MISNFVTKCANLVFNTQVSGVENLKFDEPTIIMPNHTSLADVVLLANVLPKETYFVANHRNAEKYKSLIKDRNIITINPLNPYSLRSVLKVIKEGKPVVIFPEGRITRTGTLMKIYQGVGFLALKTEAKVIPVFIDGLLKSKYSYLNDFYKKRTYFPKPKLAFGEPFKIKKVENLSMRKQKENAAGKILSILQDGILKLKEKEQVNLFNELIIASKEYGEKTVISEDINGKARYKDILLNSYVLSKKFDGLLGTEQTAGILMPNVNAHIVTLFSLFKLGKTPAILNYSAGPQTLKDNLETANIDTVITSMSFIKSGKLEPLLEVIKKEGKSIIFLDKKDGETEITYFKDGKERIISITAIDKISGMKDYLAKTPSLSLDNNEIVLFTSGSESKPKGVILTHKNLLSNIDQCLSVIDVTSKDTILNVLPMFHSFGFTIGTILPILRGIKLFTYPNPLHYRIIPEIAYNKMATIIFGTATFLAGYGKYANEYDFFKMRYVVCGGEKLKPEVQKLWFDKFGVRILEGYGITETSPVLALNTPVEYKPGTVGKVLPGIDYKIEPVEGIENGGNLLVKGPNIAKGYLIHGKGFVPLDEWYETGDVVEVDANGYMSIKSRLKRFAKLGGEMISLNLIEQLAKEKFENSEFATINVPDKRKGEQIICYTTDENISKEDLKEYISSKGYTNLYIPSKLIYIKELPLLGSGKVNYVSLKENYK